jgi:cytochrome c1
MNQFREYKSDEAKLKVYAHRIALAQNKHDQWAGLGREWVNRYENKPNPKQFSGNGHHVSVPTGTSIIDSLFSSLTATDVSAMVQALGQGTRDQEELATAALSKEWEVAKVNQRVARAVKDSLLVGIGWVKTGFEYRSTVETVARKQEAISADVQALLDEAEANGHDIDAQTIGNLVPVEEQVEKVLTERIVVDYVPWDKVLWDPTAKQVEDIRWVAQVTLMHPEEVKNHPVWKEYCARNKTARKLRDLGGDSFVDLGVGSEQNKEEERVTVVELYDFETGTVCTFPRNGDFLLHEGVNPFALNEDLEDKSPFVPLVLRQSPGRVRGISEMEVLMPTLEEMDLYHSKLATYLERMAPKVLGPKGALTDSGREAMASQEYGAFVELETGYDASQVQDFKPPTLPAEVFGVPDKLEQAAREATGVNELMRGLFPDRKRTATETAEVVQSSAARQAEKRVQFERFLEAIARRILQLMQMYYTADRMVRYVDRRGPVEWSWNADDIILESRLQVVLTPKEVKNWQSRRDDALAVLNILGPLAQPGPNGDSVVDQAALLEYVLEELALPKTVVATLLNLPEEQQAQQMAAQQMQAAQVGAQMGVPRADMVPGPMDEAQLAAATNQGTIPPEMLAAAFGNTPVSPQATEAVSESLGPAGA